MSLDEALCQHEENVENTSFCYNTGSGWTCFQAVLAINTYPTSQSFEAVIIWCNSAVPGSTLITINSLESQGTVKSFIELANHSIVLDAPTQLSANVSLEWSWIKRPIPTGKSCQFCKAAELSVYDLNLNIVSLVSGLICAYNLLLCHWLMQMVCLKNPLQTSTCSNASSTQRYKNVKKQRDHPNITIHLNRCHGVSSITPLLID